VLLWEAMIRADKAGDLSGEGIIKHGFNRSNYWTSACGCRR
jgi:hypothetical protein